MPYYRRNVYVLSGTIFLAALSWNQVMPFLAIFLRDMGVPKSELPYWIGVAFAAQAFASMIVQPFWGKLGDSHGRKPMIIRAGICLTAVYFGMSICRTPLELVALRFLNGALTGFIPGSYALIATNTPQEYAPRSLATAQSMANAGLIGGPALGGLLAGLAGYRGSMQVAGAAVLISTLLVWWLVKEPNRSVDPVKTSLYQDFVTSVRSPVQSSLMFAVFVAWTSSVAVAPYLALHLKNLLGNGPDWVVGVMYSLPAAAFVLTAHFWAATGERRGFEKTIFAGMLVGGMVTLSLVFTRSVWLFGLIYFSAGICTAAVSPSIASLTCAKIVETFRGRAYAIQQSAGTLGGLIAPLVAAKLVAAFGMSCIFAYSSASLIVGALVFRILIRRRRAGDALAPS